MAAEIDQSKGSGSRVMLVSPSAFFCAYFFSQACQWPDDEVEKFLVGLSFRLAPWRSKM